MLQVEVVVSANNTSPMLWDTCMLFIATSLLKFLALSECAKNTTSCGKWAALKGNHLNFLEFFEQL